MPQDTSKEYQDLLDAMKNDTGKKPRKFWTPNEGKNPIRILPPLKVYNEKLFYFRYRIHWINGKSFISLNQDITDSAGNVHTARKSILDRTAEKFWNQGEKGSDEWEIAKEIASRERYVYRIVVRGKEDETIPEFYETGPQIFSALKDLVFDPEYGNIVDPMTGRDFVVVKVGTGARAKYDTSRCAASSSPIFEDREKLKAVIENAKNLQYESNIVIPNEEDMKEALNEFFENKGIRSGGVSVQGSSVSKKSSHDDDESDNEDEHEPAPAKKTKKTERTSEELDDILSEFN